MAVTLVVEDGTGLANANSYVSLADADAYFDARSHATAWTALVTAGDDDARNRLLITATNLIDREAISRYGGWLGSPLKSTQRLAWPRAWVPVADPLEIVPATYSFGGISGIQYVASDAVPRFIKEATYELALLTATEDRTLDPQGQGITAVSVGPVSVSFDKSGREVRKPLGPNVLALLLPYLANGGGHARIERVA